MAWRSSRADSKTWNRSCALMPAFMADETNTFGIDFCTAWMGMHALHCTVLSGFAVLQHTVYMQHVQTCHLWQKYTKITEAANSSTAAYKIKSKSCNSSNIGTIGKAENANLWRSTNLFDVQCPDHFYYSPWLEGGPAVSGGLVFTASWEASAGEGCPLFALSARLLSGWRASDSHPRSRWTVSPASALCRTSPEDFPCSVQGGAALPAAPTCAGWPLLPLAAWDWVQLFCWAAATGKGTRCFLFRPCLSTSWLMRLAWLLYARPHPA